MEEVLETGTAVIAESIAVVEEVKTLDEHKAILLTNDVEKLHDYIRRMQARLGREATKNRKLYEDNVALSQKCLEHYTVAQKLARRMDPGAGTGEQRHCFLQKADGTGELHDLGPKSSLFDD